MYAIARGCDKEKNSVKRREGDTTRNKQQQYLGTTLQHMAESIFTVRPRGSSPCALLGLLGLLNFARTVLQEEKQNSPFDRKEMAPFQRGGGGRGGGGGILSTVL